MVLVNWTKIGVIAAAVLVGLALLPFVLRRVVRLSANGVAWLAWWWNGGQEASVYPCPMCGYDVRATPHLCPECGTKLMWGLLPGRKDRR